jgi:choline dehydrogenase-like flavoprotein
VTNDQQKENIEVLVETLVDKINFDNSSAGTPRATSVSLVAKDGSRRTVTARKEIIVSAGAYCSPAVLLRSGIGAREELAKHSISCVVDSPGVGKNLLDHLIVFTFYETEQEGLTNDRLVYHDNAIASSYMLYKEKKTGVLSTFPFGAFGYARLDDRLADSELWQNADRKQGRDPMGLTKRQPHVEYFTTELYGGPKQYENFPIDKKHAFAMITELFAPHSKGTVTLKSTNPEDNPVIDCNYLSHPLDLLVLTEGVRLGNEIVMQGSGTKNVVKGSWPADLTHHGFTERDQWVEHVKKEATTCYHAAGTCRMGKDGDEGAVLDAELKVRGVEGLRVVDVSVMPTLHGGHTQMPAYGIGEKAADLIAAAWAKG